MKVLITGAAGKLGSAISRQLAKKHEIVGVDVVGEVDLVLDVTAYESCRLLLKRANPDLVLHTAAWTDVNGCALNPDKALRINGQGTGNIAAVSAQLGIPMLYVSTNEVFDGKRSQPYSEYDAPNPINAYAYSKWYGERALQQINPRHYIVRTAWLFAQGGGNFVQAILNAAAAETPLRVVVNEVANPTYTEDLAAAIAQLIETERFGVYHLVNEGVASRWGFARFVLDQAGYSETGIERISRHQWQRPSLPPEYTALANLAGASIGIRLRPWQESISAFLQSEGFRS